MTISNWSGYHKWQPNQVKKPTTAGEIQRIVQQAAAENKKIRPVGSVHSFVPLSATNEVYLNLENYQGIVNINAEEKQVTVKAGTKLNLLGDLLFAINLAQENLGDIDQQSIAGSISTGTHGTGTNYGNLSTQIKKIKFINGLGEEQVCSATDKPNLFKAMQVSLGAMGVITELTLQCVPAYNLELVKKKENLEEVLTNLDEYNKSNRNFEFYWLPYTNKTQTKYTNISKQVSDKNNFGTWLNDVFLENHVFKVICDIAKVVPNLNKGVSKLSAALIGGNTKIHKSHKVFATPRYVKFNEMEYNIPAENYKDVVKDVISTINKNKFNIHFPIENRFVKEDDIYLSPAYKRQSAYMAVHVYKGKDFKRYFNAMETIFVAYGGRPHWGKMHTRKAAYFKSIYPEWGHFIKIRNEQDPNQLFINDYLKKLLFE